MSNGINGKPKPEVSIVVPVHNEDENILELSERIYKTLNERNISFEVIFVDDGSTDATFEKIEEGRRKFGEAFRGIGFNRNFGKSYAYSAGFEEASGNVVVTLDGDLQDDPAEIPKLLDKIDEGFDLVTGWKYKGKGPVSKSAPSFIFNAFMRYFMKMKIHDFNCPLKAYRREVSQRLKLYGEMHRFIPALAYWQGYRIAEVEVENYPRKYGKSKYGIGRFLRGFLDFTTVVFLTRYLRRPLHLFGVVGIIFGLVGFVIDLYLTISGIISGRIGHMSLLLLGLFLIVIGIQFVFTGLLAEMLYSIQEKKEKEYIITKRIG